MGWSEEDQFQEDRIQERITAEVADWKQRAEAAEADAEQAIKYQEHYRGKWKSAEAEVARLREALQRIADARAGDHRTLHPFDCSDFARQALAQEQADG